jgi:DNA replication and repair protein RecF
MRQRSKVRLATLTLSGFRNYHKRVFTFKNAATVVVGRNAVGKTNILEAIYLLASGDSFRAEKIEEMVNWNYEVSHVGGTVSDTELRVTLTRGELQGRRVQKRGYAVNGVPRRKIDFAGNLTAVIFRPEDVGIITGSPSKRRDFLDGVLIQVDREYRRAAGSYEKGLRRRNRLLDLIKEGDMDRRALVFWDQLLIKEGNILTEARRQLVDFMNTANVFPKELQIAYDPSLISESRLEQYAQAELASGHTLVGPHRDDFKIVSEISNSKFQDPNNNSKTIKTTKIGSRDLAVYGSRGEQRMGILWMKMLELMYIEEQTGERPLLLLDDIFSELDSEHDAMVMGLLGKQQTIITTTDIEDRFINDGVEIVRLEES